MRTAPRLPHPALEPAERAVVLMLYDGDDGGGLDPMGVMVAGGCAALREADRRRAVGDCARCTRSPSAPHAPCCGPDHELPGRVAGADRADGRRACGVGGAGRGQRGREDHPVPADAGAPAGHDRVVGGRRSARGRRSRGRAQPGRLHARARLPAPRPVGVGRGVDVRRAGGPAGASGSAAGLRHAGPRRAGRGPSVRSAASPPVCASGPSWRRPWWPTRSSCCSTSRRPGSTPWGEEMLELVGRLAGFGSPPSWPPTCSTTCSGCTSTS